MKPVLTHDAAQAEFDVAISWYNGQRPGLGLELVDELKPAVQAMSANSAIGARYRNTNYQFYRVKRFPYILYFRDLPSMIGWLPAHGRRRPNYWQRRTPP